MEHVVTEQVLAEIGSSEVVVRALLERGAREAPDEVFVRFEDGGGWTRRQALTAAYRGAHVLRTHGVRHGDRVLLLLPNGPAFLTVWWAAAVLGAVIVPLNTAFRGAVLERSITAAAPWVLVVDAGLADRLTDLDLPVELSLLVPDDLHTGPDEPPVPDEPIGLWDDQIMVTTSGTTGPPKLTRISYLYPYAGYASILLNQGCTAGDVFQVDLPLFHMAALGYTHACLITRTRFAVPTLLTAYGCTETSAPLLAEASPGSGPGFCGRPRPGWEVRLVDADDRHYFVDRSGDSIRRRGENISALDVEQGVATHPGVLEVAAVAVASDTGVEHEVKAFVVARRDLERVTAGP